MKLNTTILFLLSIAIFSSTVAQKSKPNIIFVLADDAGYADYQPYNQMFDIPNDVRMNTPAIARLADEGVRFTNAHTCGSVCQPSRYALMTGMYSHRRLISGNPVEDGNPFIPNSQYTMPKMLQKNGYQTAMFGKWHLDYLYSKIPGSKVIDHVADMLVTPNDVGFDHAIWLDKGVSSAKYFMRNRSVCRLSSQVDYSTLHPNKAPWNGHSRWQLTNYKKGEPLVEIAPDERKVLGDVIVDHALEYMEEAVTKNKPFFMYVASIAPHAPHIPNDSINNMPLALGAKLMDGNVTKSIRQKMVYENDVIIAQIMEQLKRLGIEKNTIVIFSSDNGPGAPGANKEGSAGTLRGYKGTAWEGGHRVPLIVKWPKKIKPGTINTNLVSQVDLFATLADIVGNKKAVQNDSKSFYALLRGKDKVTREWAFAAKHKPSATGDPDDEEGGRNIGAVCYNGRKLIIEYVPATDSYKFTHFYRLDIDPSEQNNLIKEPGYQQELDSLRKHMKEVYDIKVSPL